MTLWQHWMVGQVDASIASALLLAIALLARRALSPRVRSALLLIALARLVLPPWMRSPWSEALVDLPPIDDTRLLVTAWLRDDVAFALFLATTVVTIGLLFRLALQSNRLAGRISAFAAPPPALQASVDRLSGGTSIQLRISTSDDGPFAAGLFRKTIVLPASLVEHLDAEAMEAVLAHEVAHHSRGDLFWIAAAALLKAIAWFNPLAHLIARALVATREDGSDDWAMTRTSARSLRVRARVAAISSRGRLAAAAAGCERAPDGEALAAPARSPLHSRRPPWPPGRGRHRLCRRPVPARRAYAVPARVGGAR